MGPFESQVCSITEAFKKGDVIDAQTARNLVQKIRGSGKNRGNGASPEAATGELIYGMFPMDVFRKLRDRDYGDYIGFLRASTDPDRVARYARAPIQRPVHLVMGRRGKVWVTDGGHRLVATDLRGDSHVPAIMEPKVFEKYQNQIK